MPLMIGCPQVGGAGLGLCAAKLTIVSNTPTEQRVKATKARGLKRPDCEEGFFFMRFSFVKLQRRLSLTIRKLRPDRMLFFRSLKSAAEIFGPTMFLPHLSILARASHACLQSDGTRCPQHPVK